MERICNWCHARVDGSVEEGIVRSNVRRFRNETFRLWRCPHCLGIHATDEVDLAHYYASYPFHSYPKVDWVARAMLANQLFRLRRAGLSKHHRILDYGCGGGAFVEFLRENGYEHAVGFDEYCERYRDRSVLDAEYDLVLSQDVIEHVPEPWDLLREFDRLIRPGGLVVIGTPNSEDVDLEDAEASVHALHQPYHRHIMSKRLVSTLAEPLGWELVRYYRTMFTNTLIPGANLRFIEHYLRINDDTADLGMEPIHFENPKFWCFKTFYLALFGYFNAPELAFMAIYRAKQKVAQLADTVQSSAPHGYS
jgi:2-polyprenyl-3-methyl-5-hydroxy-6-metoxy-1,4-benzoquinol methylase